MRITILNINYAPEMISTGLYNTGLAEGLARRGHAVRMVTAHPYYPQWRTWEGHRGIHWTRTQEHGVEVVRCPIYVPATPTGPRRILHYISFMLSAAGPMLVHALRGKPDWTIVVAPSILCGPLGWLASRLARGRAWIHVQDFEVGAAFATGLLQNRSGSARLALWVERSIIGLFDRASSISPEMCRKLEQLGVPGDRVHQLRNWADIAAIRPMDGPSPLRRQWGIATPHVALYSGNIANKQGLDVVVETARLMQGRKDLTFVICGEGPSLEALKARAGALDNIQFHPLQPRERLNDLLGLATIHLLPQKADAADLVLPSKLTNMLASGRPVIATAAAGTGLAREVEGSGLVCEPENPAALADAITRLIDAPDLYARCARHARESALRDWDREAILDRLDEELNMR